MRLSRTSAGGGIGQVAIALIASGFLVNAYLAIVARSIPAQDYLYFSSYWSLALVVGFGVFLPIEQELARLLHGSTDHWPALRSGVLVAGSLAGIELLLVLASAPFLLPSLGNRTGILAALAAFCLVSAGQFAVRGVLIGLNRMRAYAVVLFCDGALRVLFAAALGVLANANSTGYAWTLVMAVAGVHLPMLLILIYRARTGLTSAGPAGSLPRRFAKAVGPLLLGSLAAQLLLNGIPVLVAATAGANEQAAAGQFQAAFQLVRIPLFLALPLQTTILPALTKLFRSGRRDVVVSMATRLVSVLFAVGVAGVAIGYALGPLALRVVFGARYHVPRSDLAILALAVTFYLGLVLLTQALVAAALHAKVAWSWLVGLVAAVVVFVAIPDLVLAAELSFLMGSGSGWLFGMTRLSVWNRNRADSGRI
jgi:O-antigen/teichoic acid export membrane protein